MIEEKILVKNKKIKSFQGVFKLFCRVHCKIEQIHENKKANQ